MAGIVTSNVTLTPQGGWTQLAVSATSFLRLSKNTHHIPVYLAFGASAPADGAGTGFRWDCGETFFECAIAVKVWARLQKTANGNVVVSVFND